MPPSSAHLKGAIVDKYAEIALYDAAENQKVILESQRLEAKKKAEMRASLDEQVRLQQEALKRDRVEEMQWVKMEQDRIKVWNNEEKVKIEQVKAKEESIKSQRAQQLRELAALRERERKDMADYEMGILRSIHKEIKMEKAKEQAKRESDAENLRQVAVANVEYQKLLKVQKQQEIDAARALEAQWSELLDKQERARTRQLNMTYARQARQYGAAESMQEKMNRLAKEDEERMVRAAAELEAAAAKKEYDEKEARRRKQQEMTDILAIQTREKLARAQAEREREQMVIAREREDIARGDRADAKKRETMHKANTAYANELKQQMQLQEERKVLEPFLMSKAERQMNAALLRRLPGGAE